MITSLFKIQQFSKLLKMIFHMKKCDIFIFAQNIDRGYTLEPPL